MALPQAIQAQVDQAEALLQQVNNPPQETPIEQMAQPEPVVEQAPQPQEATPPAPAPEPAPQPKPENWEHKYRTLQGRYNSDVPRLQSEVRDLSTKLQEAITKMEELSKAPAKAEPQPATADPKDVDAFGQDLVDMVMRTTDRALANVAGKVQALAAQLEQRIAKLEQALQGTTQTVAMTAEQTFFDRLTKLVPDWEEVNANPAFLDWLAEVDPFVGGPRQLALNDAQAKLNAERAAAVFQAFVKTLPAAPKADPVGKQVTPRASAATAAPTPTEKPILTQKQIKAFYDDVARGAYRGREADMQKAEAIINTAIAEGRVR